MTRRGPRQPTAAAAGSHAKLKQPAAASTALDVSAGVTMDQRRQQQPPAAAVAVAVDAPAGDAPPVVAVAAALAPPAATPDPLVIVARLLSLDDLLAARAVCRAWRASLSTGFVTRVRLPHSLWSEAGGSQKLAAAVTAAVAAYPNASTLLLDEGGARPGLAPALWPPLLRALAAGGIGGGGTPNHAAPNSSGQHQQQQQHHHHHHQQQKLQQQQQQQHRLRAVDLRLRSPPSPRRLEALAAALLPPLLLRELRLRHVGSALSTRHLAAIAQLTALRGLAIVHARGSGRGGADAKGGLGHARARRVPLCCDCLSALTGLTRLELVSQARHSGDLLADTAVAFTRPAALAALTGLRALAIAEAALRLGPGAATITTSQWLSPLTALTALSLAQVDEPTTTATSRGGGARGGGGGAGGRAVGGGGGGSSSGGAGSAGGGSSGGGGTESLSSSLNAALAAASRAVSNAAASVGREAAARAAAALNEAAAALDGVPVDGGGSSGGSAVGGSSSSGSGGAAALLPGPPLDLAAALPGLLRLHLANVAGERLVKLRLPPGLRALALHLASPSPGEVTGEQLGQVVLQAPGLVVLELGLGLRFCLGGAVMRSLKRGLRQLADLTLCEGALDHLEGLGCWCNLPRLHLVEGRCTMPLRGCYELSMRAAMGRVPRLLRYTGHVRHVGEVGTRLGPALKELRVDSLAGLGAAAAAAAAGAAAAAASRRRSRSGGGGAALLALTAGGGEGSGGGGGRGEDDSGGSESGDDDDDEASAPASGSSGPRPLAQLVALTRLEVVGDRVGVLDAATAAAIAALPSLRALRVESSGDAWLAPCRGVKEQLSWLRALRGRLRQLRLGGVMLGRGRLAAAPAADAPAGAADDDDAPGPGGGGGGGSKAAGARSAPAAVKGLGNGLASSSGGGSSSSSSRALTTTAAAATAAAVGASVLAPPLTAAAAAERDRAAALCIEELRRWLCELLPNCRVWLD